MADEIASTTPSPLNLLWDFRDSRLARRGEMALLAALITRSNPARKFSCFPSYQQLADDTGYDTRTLKNYMRSLEEKSVIRRQFRGRSSNVIYLNVDLIHETAERNRAEADAASSPFDPPPAETNEEPENPPPVEQDALEKDPGYRYDLISDAPTLLWYVATEMWPRHPTVIDPVGYKSLEVNLSACIEIAPGVKRCAELLQYIRRYQPKVFDRVTNSTNLGAYLRNRMPEWVEKYGQLLTEKGDEA